MIGDSSVWTTEILCLLTRSTNGYLRQAAVRNLLHSSEPWAIPYVVLLAGEYVIEIGADLKEALSELDRASYRDFVRGNPHLLSLMKARATSYWSCYYRFACPDRRNYPALIFLQRLEEWAR